MKGHLLASPKGSSIRPTSDRVREAIFNIIGQDLSGLKVLDIFAGTGSLGLEALSRGALRAVFIDSSQKSINLLKKNLALCGVQECGTLIKKDLRRGIPGVGVLSNETFDLIFLDPPYGRYLLPVVLEAVTTRNIISPGGRVVAESSKTGSLRTSFGNLRMTDSRVYGDTKIRFYTNEKGLPHCSTDDLMEGGKKVDSF